jgi:NH3-dependent NAD+ synthetase
MGVNHGRDAGECRDERAVDDDAVLEGYIEQYRSVERLVADGHDRALVAKVTGMVDHAEYKRRQAPPGVKVTGRAFGRERRLPVTNRWSG